MPCWRPERFDVSALPALGPGIDDIILPANRCKAVSEPVISVAKVREKQSIS